MSRNVDGRAGSRRNKRRQWLHDASILYRMHLLFFYGLAASGPDRAAAVLREKSAERRARRLARRRAQ